jgi:nucleoside-diphosphate-sugar epimerase
MEILVTGATGFLGRYLVSALLERGEKVRALALPIEDTTWLEDRGVAIFPGDLRKRSTLVEPMRSVDGVFHLAAMTRVWRPMEEYRAVNVEGTRNLCNEVLRSGVRRLVHVSSAVIYGLGIGRPASEDLPLAPIREPYSWTKAEGDLLVQRMANEDQLPAVIIRPGTVFGVGDSLNFGRIADRLLAGKALIVGSGNNALTFVYVSDVINGMLLAFDHEHADGEIYNVGNDQPLTQNEMLNAIAESVGAKPPSLRVPYSALYALASLSELLANLSGSRIPPIATRQGIKLYGTDNRLPIDKARREISYEPQIPLREGITLTGEWYMQHQKEPVPWG